MWTFAGYAGLVMIGLAVLAVLAILAVWIVGLAFGAAYMPLLWMSEGVQAIIRDWQQRRQRGSRSAGGH